VTLSNKKSDADEGCYVIADRQRLKQVLLNLIANGINYNVSGGTVETDCREVGGSTELTVADTGIGIPDGMGERLFAPFDRLGKEGGDVEGTGLGLSLSRSLVEAMGGTIAATRNEDAGSTFTVTLKASTGAYESPAPALVTPESQSTDGLVLYIEDNLANFRLVEQVLSRRPLVRVLPAMQASIGLQLARAHLPDLIILDLNLPDMGGEETLQNLLENPATRSIPVVIASADATPRRIKKLLGLGARAYLTKPIDVSQLLATVDEYLNSSMR
jgi:CheY-like chemotaxis protein